MVPDYIYCFSCFPLPTKLSISGALCSVHYVIGIYYCIVSCSPPSGLEFPDYRGEAYYWIKGSLEIIITNK